MDEKPQNEAEVKIIEEVKQSGAPEGNQNATKWKTPEERIKACKEYCKYLEKGKPKEYFPLAGPATINDYIKNFPIEFDSEMIEKSERIGKEKLINIGYAGMTGNIKGFNSRTWEFVVQNMTRWKLRTDVTTDDEKLASPLPYLPAKDNEK